MRTLAVLHTAEVGGPPQHVRPWLNALAERGPLEVVAPGAGPALELYNPIATTTVMRYEALTFPTGLLELGRMGVRFGCELLRFRRHLRLTRPDLVVVVTSVIPAALVAARLERLPTVVYVGEIFDKRYVRGRARTVAGYAVRQLTQRSASALVCCSQTVARQFHAGEHHPIVATVYHGVDVPRVTCSASVRPKDTMNGPSLAVVGNITAGRGQDVAVRALRVLVREFPLAHLVIAGQPLPRPPDRKYEEDLRRLVSRLGLDEQVVFAGFVDPIGDVYAAADVVVNPARFNEPFGQVALEALVAGRPVVATRVGAIPEVLADGCDALLVEPDDPEALAAAVARVWQDEELRRRLVETGRARVLDRFSEDAGVDAFCSVADAVLARAYGSTAERDLSRNGPGRTQ